MRGYVEFTQNYESGPVTIDIQLTGLSPGLHAFHIHEFPVSEGDCMTAGAHFNPDKVRRKVELFQGAEFKKKYFESMFRTTTTVKKITTIDTLGI